MTVDAYNYAGFYTIVLTQYAKDSIETIRKIFADCWSLPIANAIVLIPSENYQSVYLFTFFPYTPEHCNYVEPIEYDHFKNGSFTHNKTIFPDKFQNFYKCPLIVQTVVLPSVLKAPESNDTKGGMEIFDDMKKYLNFSIIVHYRDNFDNTVNYRTFFLRLI